MLFNGLRFLSSVFHTRKILFDLAKNDFKSKYTNSLLGIVWAFMLPLVTILVLWFVFQFGFRSEPVDGVPFILWYIPAFLSWNFFTDALSNASASIWDYSYLVKNMNFRVSTLPLMRIVSSSFVHVFFVGFIFAIYAVYGKYPRINNIQIFYYYICTVLLLMGLTWFMSAIAVFSKDVLNVIALVTQVGFWATPIIWNPENMPASIHRVLMLNPMYYICCGYREAFTGEAWFWDHPALTAYFWGVTVILLFIGAHTFYRLRPQFADML